VARQGGECICQSRGPPIEPRKLVIAPGLGNCIGTRGYRDVPCGHNHGDKWTVLMGNLIGLQSMPAIQCGHRLTRTVSVGVGRPRISQPRDPGGSTPL
jgi:hypothetical protein